MARPAATSTTANGWPGRFLWPDTAFTRLLGLRLPIVQGPFGGGLSSAGLAAVVSAGGGLGSFGAHHLAPEAIGPRAADLCARTARPFALNLWISNRDSVRTACKWVQRFWPATSRAPRRVKLFSPDARYTALVRLLSGRRARGLRNRLLETLEPAAADALPYSAQSRLTGRIRAAALAQNRPDLLTIWGGQAAPLLRHHRAADLLAWLAADTEAQLARLGALSGRGWA